jgi:enoyl-CoA hydratase
MSEHENLLVECRDALTIVTINRPKALNALNSATLTELGSALEAIATDRHTRVVIVTGSGEKAFVAGADISEMRSLSPEGGREFAIRGQRVFAQLEELPQPVIAAVNGFALGGGCELAMACDIRIAAENAKFAQPETGLGITPGFGGTQRLRRLVGPGRAKELLFTGDTIDAAEAVRIGLADRLVPVGGAMTAAAAMAEKIAAKGAAATRYTKAAVQRGADMNLAAATAYEAEVFALCFADPEQARRMSDFLDKRAPRRT